MRDLENIQENDVIEFITETSDLIKSNTSGDLSRSAENIVTAGASDILATRLTNDVEFWKWMGLNYNNLAKNNLANPDSIAKSAEAMKISIQGKGYEWDYMTNLRNDPRNIFSRIDAGIDPTQPGIDITKTDMVTGNQSTYQNKAYTSNNSLDLHNTPKDATVVTNSEKVADAKAQGYNTESFQDSKMVTKNTQRRIADGKAYRNTSYTFKNVAGVMAKAVGIGFVVGCTTEAILCYRQYKNGQITKEEYIKNILASGGEIGVTAAATSGIMVPISAAITAAGLANPIAIPISFVIAGAVNKIVAPAFGRGDYLKILRDAKYYRDLTDMSANLAIQMEQSGRQFREFLYSAAEQHMIFLKQKTVDADLRLKDQNLTTALGHLYNEI
ncbi:hypothetical protein AGMMS49957_11490 [Synergistales bacterium]|nr:hypothetical protein AGMMS49957_11490 [Synergistales bacterium]